jgi:hypothetical protein
MSIEFQKLRPTTRLSRAETTAALRAAGFPISVSTLEQRAFRRDGPPYFLFLGKAIYIWGEALAWAQGDAKRCSPGERSPLARSPEPPIRKREMAGA